MFFLFLFFLPKFIWICSSRPLYFPPSDTSYFDDIDLQEGTFKLPTGELNVGGSKGTPSKNSSDLDLCSMVTLDDFWEGAFRLEREHRIKLEDSLAQFRTSQQVASSRWFIAFMLTFTIFS